MSVIEQDREDLVSRITILCVESALLRDVKLQRFNEMLDEITAAIIRCKPDPPGMIR